MVGGLAVDGHRHTVGHTDGTLRFMVDQSKVDAQMIRAVGRKEVDLMIYYLQYDVDTVFIEVDLLIFCLREIQLHHRLSVDGDQRIGTCAGLSHPEERKIRPALLLL